MPNAFQAWDLEAKAAVMSGLGMNTLKPPSLPIFEAQVKVLVSCMTSVMDGQRVSIYICYVFCKWKKHL